VEVSFGSILHGAQVPLRGLFLSTLQSVMLTFAGEGLGKRWRVVWVPFIAASLKALSPAGNRLRPMLAITVQGILYGGAVSLLGWNPAGVAAGGWLVGAWSALQGIALQYLFVGSDLLAAYDSVIRWGAGLVGMDGPGFLPLLGGWMAFCGTIGAASTLGVWRRRKNLPANIRRLLETGAGTIRLHPVRPTWRGALRAGGKDLLRPLFWLPVGVVILILFATGSPWESGLWIAVRSASVAFVLFSLARSFNPRTLISRLRARGMWGPALALEKAVEKVSTDPHR
jgi:hypothetical protein